MLILLMSFGVYNVLIMWIFFKIFILEVIIELVWIDGGSELWIFWSIVVFLVILGIVIISLFMLLGYWNDWMNVLLYINKDSVILL